MEKLQWHKEENIMNWKRVISGVLAAAMLSALPVQLLASAEGAEAAAEVNTWEDLTSVESPEDSNTFYYNKNGYTFEKLSHPEKDVVCISILQLPARSLFRKNCFLSSRLKMIL